MKNRIFLPRLAAFAASLGCSLLGWSQASEPGSGSILERGANRQRIEAVHEVMDEEGNTRSVTSSYIQLELGLNFLNAQGNWEETKPEFELVPEGAIAWKGQHKVSLAGDLNTAEKACCKK